MSGGTAEGESGRWVKGAKAGRNAGRRQECLPHNESLDHNRTGPQALRPAPQKQPTAQQEMYGIISDGVGRRAGPGLGPGA